MELCKEMLSLKRAVEQAKSKDRMGGSTLPSFGDSLPENGLGTPFMSPPVASTAPWNTTTPGNLDSYLRTPTSAQTEGLGSQLGAPVGGPYPSYTSLHTNQSVMSGISNEFPAGGSYAPNASMQLN